MSSVPARCDAVVVGSGFGGSINALRLAEVCKSVHVLERGRRYPPGRFPRDRGDARGIFWRYPQRPGYRGFYEVQFFSGLAAVVASGVGIGRSYTPTSISAPTRWYSTTHAGLIRSTGRAWSLITIK
jgi:choline dehydrogenase-like flavoprotein